LKKDTIRCFFHYGNYQPKVLPDSLKLVVLVTFPVIEDVFKKMWDCVDKAKTTVHFLIENEEKFELLNSELLKKISFVLDYDFVNNHANSHC